MKAASERTSCSGKTSCLVSKSTLSHGVNEESSIFDGRDEPINSVAASAAAFRQGSAGRVVARQARTRKSASRRPDNGRGGSGWAQSPSNG